MIPFSFTTHIERGDEELEVEVTYNATPYVAATYIQPAEGLEIELDTTKTADGSELTDAETDIIIERCQERLEEDFADREADRADYLYEQYRDHQMMDDWEN